MADERDERLIMMEETIACLFARSEFEEAGVEDWAAFEAAHAESLALQQARFARSRLQSTG